MTQISRRENYALAASLHADGKLGCLHTDIWAANFPERCLAWALPKINLRHSAALEGANVKSDFFRYVYARLRRRRRPLSKFWAQNGAIFGRSAAKTFLGCGIGREDVTLGYTGGNLEVLKMAKACGAKAIHVQIDPGLGWYEKREELRRLYPCAESAPEILHPDYIHRITEEWHLADAVVCHSEHTRTSLVRHGVSAAKLHIVPPAYVSATISSPKSLRPGAMPRILFLGNVCLMKGFQDYCLLAKKMAGRAEFHCAGTVHMASQFMQEHASEVRMHGHLSPARVSELLDQTDVLVFPSHSEGFGLVQLEAMAKGIPVLSSTSCGDVVIEGQNGCRFEAGNVDQIEHLLRVLMSDQALYGSMSQRAIERLSEYTLEKQMRGYLALCSNLGRGEPTAE